MGLFDGLTKGLETMIGAEEATGPNIAPTVMARANTHARTHARTHA